MRFLDRLRAIRTRSAELSAPAQGLDVAVEREYQRLLADLEAARRSIADATANRRRLEAQAEQVRRAQEAASERARVAVREGQDEMARSALAEGLAAERDLEARATAIDGLLDRDAELRASLAGLEHRIHEHRARLDEARARARGGSRTRE
jgi:phage shock protein A